MKKNGFTIIELVIIIGLLMVVVGIFSVNFIRTINSQKRTANENLISQVVSSANAYVSLYPDTIKALYEDATYVDITIGTLRDNGLLSEKLIDAETGENISDDEIVRIRFNGAGVLDIKYPVTSDGGSSGGSSSEPSDIIYTLTFMNDGTKHSSRQIKSGETANGFPSLTKSGYTFDGWYTASIGGEKKSSIIMSSNQTLYARWIKVEEDLIQKIKNTARTDCSTINFASPATSDEGICTLEDDYGTSYYYRGAVTNNYVKFANFYWRIIRINGDGSVRIRYDGTSVHTNGDSSADRFTNLEQIYNSYGNDNKYVGWMYGPSGTDVSTSSNQIQTNTTSSAIKTEVDNWYKNKIVNTGYSGVVADSIFCNDRSTPGAEKTGWSADTGLGYGINKVSYGASARFVNGMGVNDYTPTFKCLNKKDAFTVKDIVKGNGALTYPVGLITADEIVAAGSGKRHTENSLYYLYNSIGSSWSMTPRSYSPGSSVFMLGGNYGHITEDGVQYAHAIAPVINLSAEYFNTLKGTGIMSDPYRVS